ACRRRTWGGRSSPLAGEVGGVVIGAGAVGAISARLLKLSEDLVLEVALVLAAADAGATAEAAAVAPLPDAVPGVLGLAAPGGGAGRGVAGRVRQRGHGGGRADQAVSGPAAADPAVVEPAERAVEEPAVVLANGAFRGGRPGPGDLRPQPLGQVVAAVAVQRERPARAAQAVGDVDEPERLDEPADAAARACVGHHSASSSSSSASRK